MNLVQVADVAEFADLADVIKITRPAEAGTIPHTPQMWIRVRGGGLQNTSFSIISGSTAVGAVFLRSGAFKRISRESIL